MSLKRRGIDDGIAVMLDGDARAIEAKVDATDHGSGESGLCALANHLAFVFGESRHDVQDEARDMGNIDGDRIRGPFHQIGNERYIARGAIQFCDQKSRLVLAADNQNLSESGPVVLAAALDLDKLGNDGAATADQVARDSFALCFQS